MGKKNEKRTNYSPRKLENALKSITEGKSFLQASKEFNIPRTTLIYKFSGKRPKDVCRPGPKCMLGDDVELEMCQWIKEIGKRGFPITKDGLRFTVTSLIKEGLFSKMAKKFNLENGPGRRWFESFFKRHPRLGFRTSEYLHKSRTAATEPVIREWFKEIKEELGDNIRIFENPIQVFNCDETSFYLHPKRPPVIVEKGQKNVYDVSATTNKENLTVLITGNANGEMAPPMALYSFERVLTIMSAAVPRNWGIGRSQNGWMTSASFYEYIGNVFCPYIEEEKIPKLIILILDGHKSHLSLPLSKLCKEKGIELIALPPNATHIMQPLDVAFFGSLKKKWQKELDHFKLENEGREVKRHHVLPILSKILDAANFKINLQNGFKVSGIFPLDPNNIDYSRCITSNTADPKRDSLTLDNDILLKDFERRIPVSIMRSFRENHSPIWRGDCELSGLYTFWQSLLSDENFKDLFMKSISPLEGTYYIFDPADENFENSVENNFLMNETSREDPNDKNLESVSNENFDEFDDVVYENLPPLQDTNYTENSESVLNIDSTFSMNEAFRENPNDKNLESMPGLESNENFDESDDVVHENLPPLQDTNYTENSQRLSNIDSTPLKEIESNQIGNTEIYDDGILPLSPDDTSLKSPERNSTSSSGSKSVKDVLDSIIRYPRVDESPVKRKVRRKISLLSVMTSSKWLELKEAIDFEKEEKEKKKIERKNCLEAKKLEQQKKGIKRKRIRLVFLNID